MTQEQMPKRLYIPQPFASGDGTSSAELIPIETESDNTDVNFVDGFPAAYSVPVSQGGLLPMRGQMNAIGNLASVNEYARACGGICTFDQRLANKIGGYAKGAVLEFIEAGMQYCRVISLVDNNTVDFTGNPIVTDTSSPDYIPDNICTSGSVDGVNWKYCGEGPVKDFSVVAKLPNMLAVPITSSGTADNFSHQFIPIGSFTAMKDGVISFNGTFTPTFHEPPSGSLSMYNSLVIAIVDEESGVIKYPKYELADFDNWEAIYTFGELIGFAESVGGTMHYPTRVSKFVTKGKRYGLFVWQFGIDVSNSTLEIVLK